MSDCGADYGKIRLNLGDTMFSRLESRAHFLQVVEVSAFRQFLVSWHNLLARSTCWGISAIKGFQLRHELAFAVEVAGGSRTIGEGGLLAMYFWWLRSSLTLSREVLRSN